MSRRVRRLEPGGRLLGSVLVLLASGCSIEKLAADNATGLLAIVRDDFQRETVPRYAREAGPALLAQINGFAAASPRNPELRLLQAEMNATFAFAFLEAEDPEWATAHYRKAQRAALAALREENEALAEALPSAALDELTAMLAEVGEDAVPALFWWGFARGAEVNLHRDDPQQILDLDRVDRVLERVLALDENYYYGGPHLFFAIRYTLLPKTLGGDPERGREHFAAVDRITGGRHLLAQVLRAEYYAPGLAATPPAAGPEEIQAAQQRAWDEWFGTLARVVRADPALWPEQALSNAVARQRALSLLADPEEHNIIPPPGAENPWAAEDDGDDGAWGDDAGAWGEASGGGGGAGKDEDPPERGRGGE